jgi:hypothetical protein
VKHRKQHTIPACYLRAWCDPQTPESQEPHVWIISKGTGKARRKAPSNILWQTDFYTLRDPAGGRDLSLEHGLHSLEDMFVALRPKLQPHERLDSRDRLVLYAFAAAMWLRTESAMDHVVAEYRPLLELGKAMEEWAKTATPEQKRAASRTLSTGKSPTMTLADVVSIVTEPATVLTDRMVSLIRLFFQFKLDLAIVETTTPLGFVTSDNPCVWADPEGHERPPAFRAPALMYNSIEITLPISPSQVLMLNRQGLDGYQSCGEIAFADEINRRTIGLAKESFVSRQQETRAEWFT